MSAETTSTAVETLLTKDQFLLFLDPSGTAYGSTDFTPTWKRVSKSTIFVLSMNPVTEEKNYIIYKDPSKQTTGYAPEIPQENELYENDPVYDLVFAMFYKRSRGSQAKLPILLCFGGSDKKAWQDNATISLGDLDVAGGKITYTIQLSGGIVEGTYVVTDGVPVFTADD